MKNSSIVIEPSSELKFTGPFDKIVNSCITLHNNSRENERAIFKVKTTAPRSYCVRPNCGMIKRGETVTVSIMLSPFEYDPNEKIRHKFMIQSMMLPNDAEIREPIDNMWRGVNLDNVNETKLRCVFEMPNENGELDNSAANTTANLSDATNQSETTQPASMTSMKSMMQSSPPILSNDDAESFNSLKQKCDEELKQIKQKEDMIVRLRNASSTKSSTSTDSNSSGAEDTSSNAPLSPQRNVGFTFYTVLVCVFIFFVFGFIFNLLITK